LTPKRGKYLCAGAIGDLKRKPDNQPDGGKEGEGGKRCEHEHFPIVVRPTRNRHLSSETAA